VDVDYVAVAGLSGHQTLVLAVRVGRTRLIDNLPLDAPELGGGDALAGTVSPEPMATALHGPGEVPS
jgi:hypothetical protein